MNHEEQLRMMLQRAGQSLPEGPRLDRESTIRKARRDHYVNLAVTGLAAAAVIAFGAIAAGALFGGEGLRPQPPAGPASPQPSLEATPTSTPTGPPEASCSATGMSPEPSAQDLPTAVARLRDLIVEAAVRCDYEELARLGTAGEGFSHSFGASDDPAGYWEKVEEDPESKEEPMAMLVRTLDVSHCVEEATSAGVTLYAWPAAQCTNSTDEDYDSLIASGLYTEKEVRLFRKGGGFLGWRIGITEDGDWLFFVAGD